MADLKAGHWNDLANSLTGAIDAAFESEWSVARPGDALGSTGRDDRRVLFAAVARGVLAYLRDHKDETWTDSPGGTLGHSHKLDLTVSDL
jgi:hypothetical protein